MDGKPFAELWRYVALRHVPSLAVSPVDAATGLQLTYRDAGQWTA
jgi:hypothetical protein